MSLADDVRHKYENDPVFKAMADNVAKALESGLVYRGDILLAVEAGIGIYEMRRALRHPLASPIKDGEPCGHAGCLNHWKHPCEGCGRIGGRS